MKSLTVDAGSTSSGVVLNMQQRVIQSGLDSLSGVDSKNIIALFQGNSYLPITMLIAKGFPWISNGRVA
jgi:hypothetical protein